VSTKLQFSIRTWGQFFGILALALMAHASAGQNATETDAPSGDVAGQDAEDAENAKTLHFVTIDVPPWAATDPETGEQQGAFVEVVAALEAMTGFHITTTLTPFARVNRELESGNHDCTILVPLDEDIVRHGETVAFHDMGIVSHRAAPIDQYEDLHGKTISVLRGLTISPRFDADTDITRVYDTDYAIALRKLARQRVDGIAGAIPTLRYLASQNGMQDLLAPALQLTELLLKFQCTLHSEHLSAMPEVNAAIRKLRDSGRLGEILAQYHF